MYRRNYLQACNKDLMSNPFLACDRCLVGPNVFLYTSWSACASRDPVGLSWPVEVQYPSCGFELVEFLSFE